MSEITGVGINPAESAERLSSPNKIFFHTTLSQNVPTLMKQGLVNVHNRDTLGKDLLYSATFAKEFNLDYVKRRNNPNGNATDFALTIWQVSPDIKQVKKEGYLKAGQYGPTQELQPGGQIPEGFIESMGGGAFNPNLASLDLRKVGPENFLASIPLNEGTISTLAEMKLYMTAKSRSVEVMEPILAEYLKSLGSITLRPGYNIEDLSRDLLSRMQQEALLYQTGPLVKEALDLGLNNNMVNKASIAELKAKQKAVIDPVSTRYLSILEGKLKDGLAKKGLGNLYDQVEPSKTTEIPLSSNAVDQYKLWGGMDGRKLIQKIAQDIGIRLPAG